MPYSQQPGSQKQQLVRRQTAEGHVSPPKTTSLVPANGNGATGVTYDDIPCDVCDAINEAVLDKVRGGSKQQSAEVFTWYPTEVGMDELNPLAVERI